MVRFFLLAFALSWTAWAPLWLPALGAGIRPGPPHLHWLGALGPLGAAFLVVAAEEGREGVARLLRSMTAWRGRMRWVVVAALGPPALLLAAAAAAAAGFGEDVAWGRLLRSDEFPGLAVPTLFALNLLTFGYGEEVGWRGVALPRLQTGRSALAATLLLTAAWALWHLPLFAYRPGYVTLGWSGVAGWLFSLFTGAILLTWLFNESRGSVLVVALFHAAMDVAFTSSGVSGTVVGATGALVTVWGLGVLALTGSADLSRRGKVTADDARS